jgi:dihydrofolate reductase
LASGARRIATGVENGDRPDDKLSYEKRGGLSARAASGRPRGAAASWPTIGKGEALMSRVRVGGFSVSLDGFGAGPEQSVENPLGRRGPELHQWMYGTRFFHTMTGRDGGSEGVDQDYADRAMSGFGAFILGRNMFGPVRGPWPDDSWKGWWGDEPPYHCPTFVLTHYPHDPIEMKGGTTFYFVTDGIESAYAQAEQAAGGRDISIAGGASCARQAIAAGLVDEIDLQVSPLILGSGERLFDGFEAGKPALELVRVLEAPGVAHLRYRVL